MLTANLENMSNRFFKIFDIRSLMRLRKLAKIRFETYILGPVFYEKVILRLWNIYLRSCLWNVNLDYNWTYIVCHALDAYIVSCFRRVYGITILTCVIWHAFLILDVLSTCSFRHEFDIYIGYLFYTWLRKGLPQVTLFVSLEMTDRVLSESHTFDVVYMFRKRFIQKMCEFTCSVRYRYSQNVSSHFLFL